MRQSLATSTMTQPFVVVFVIDAVTNLPTFGLTNYGLGALDSDTVMYSGMSVPLVATANEIVIKEMKPSGSGMGLHKREVSFNIANGVPFYKSSLGAMLYAAGATVDDFYFAVWVTDFSKSLDDIFKWGTFFGYYKLDSGLSWNESTGTTNINLIEMLTMLSGRYNQNTEAAEQKLSGSEWSGLLTSAAYLGFKQRVPAIGRVVSGIGGFESYYKSVKTVISGLVQSDVLSGTSIMLGKSPALASIVGQTVKLKMGNGCIIQGVITDLTGGDYGIDTTGMVVNTKWDTLLVYNKGFTTAGADVGDGGADQVSLQSIFLDASVPLTKLPSPTMYLRSQGTVEFYNGGPVTSAGPMFVKLASIADETTKELTCEDFKDPDNLSSKFTGVNVDYHATIQSTNYSDPDLLHLNYATWLAPQNYDLYFTNTTYVLADIQKAGMPWDLIVTPHVNSGVAVSTTYYVRLIGDNVIAQSETGQYAIYADNGNTLTPIATSEIDTIEYNNTDFSMVDLCKITLKRRLKDINEAYDENRLYVDTGPAIHAGEVISYILQAAGISVDLLAPSLRTGTNELGNVLSIAIKDQTWSELLDTVVFESGLQIDAVAGMYNARSSFAKSVPQTWNRDGGSQRFLWVQTDTSIPFGDVIDGTYKMDIGRTVTSIDSLRREFVRTHFTYKYVYSEYKGTQYRQLQSIKVAKNNDRKVDYTFEHIVDTDTALAAARQMARIGHVANYGETTRKVDIGLPMSYMQLQVMDTVQLNGFRHITAVGEPLSVYDELSATNPVYTVGAYGVNTRYDDETQFMLIPGLGVITDITYNFSGSGVPITVSVKQVQFNMSSNLREVAEALNTVAENTTAAAETEVTKTPNYPEGEFVCPAGDHVTAVTITPGEYIPGSTTTGGCCNESTTNADSYTNQKIVIHCAGAGPDPQEWPAGCLENPTVWYEVVGDSEIGNSDSIVYKLYCFASQAPTIISLHYPGQAIPDTCVSFAYRDNSSGWNAWFGTLTIPPCVFNAPEGVTDKCIQLEFDVRYCTSTPLVVWNPTLMKYERERIYKVSKQIVCAPVSLRPVSDITVS